MGLNREDLEWRTAMRLEWGDELAGLPLNYFADKVPAGFAPDLSMEALLALPVLSRQGDRALTRRGCLAAALDLIKTLIECAADDGMNDPSLARPGESWFDDRLPSAFAAMYDSDFYCRLHDSVSDIENRMSMGTFTAPHSTIEEMLVGILLNEYSVRINAIGLQPGYVDLDSLWLMDDDYTLLYNLDRRLVTSPKRLKAFARQMDAVNLDFDSWFLPFSWIRPQDGTVHPDHAHSAAS